MLNKIKTITMFLLITVTMSALTGEEILRKVDENITPDSVKYTGKMIIHRGGRVQTKEMQVYGRGADESFVEFLAPPRDRGTKYLRTEDNLWMYLPGANRTVRISGHMLRQSMMGSDFSYEDQTSRNKLYEQYNSEIIEENENEYVVKLTTKPGEETTYYRRIMWVEKSDFSLIKQEMYAQSGRLLKVMEVLESKNIDGRNYPVRIRMEDKVRAESFTEIVMEDIQLDIEIDERIFTFQNLERR